MQSIVKSLVIALAVASLTTACAKKSDGGAPADSTKETPQQAAEKEKAAKEKAEREKLEKEKAEKEKAEQAKKEGRANPRAGEKKDGTQKDSEKKPGTNIKGEKEDPKKPKGLHEKQKKEAAGATPVTADEISAIKNEAQKYTGSAEDSLRDYLMLRFQALQDGEQKSQNLRLASQVVTARLQLNTRAHQAQVTVSLVENGKLKNLVMNGTLVESGGVKKAKLFSTQKNISGVLTCLDELSEVGATCQTTVAEIRYQKADVSIVFRQGNITMHGKFGEKQCLTKECEKFYTLLRFTEEGVKDPNTVRSLTMESFEVIMGRTAFKVIGLTNEQEVLKFEAPLLKSDDGSQDVAVNQSLTKEELVDPVTSQYRKTRMNESLNDVRLAYNDGYGHINLLVKMKVLENGSRDMFQLELKRFLRPVRALIMDPSLK